MSSDSEEFQSADEDFEFEGFDSSEPTKRLLTQFRPLPSSPSPQTTPLSSDEEEADESDIDKDSDNKNPPSELEYSNSVHHISAISAAYTPVEDKPEEATAQKSDNKTDKELKDVLSRLSIQDIVHENLKSTEDTLTKESSPDNDPMYDTLKNVHYDSENNKELICLKTDVDDNAIKENNDNDRKNSDSENIEKFTESSCNQYVLNTDTVLAGERDHKQYKKGEKDGLHHIQKVVKDEKINTETKQDHEVEIIRRVEIKETGRAQQAVVTQRMTETNQSDDSKVSNKGEGTNTEFAEIDSGRISKPKTVRESKIGMKKPREKLGERLGSRKLGSRIEKKTLDNISSDSITKLKDCTNKANKINPVCVVDEEEKLEREVLFGKQVDDKHKQQEWEEQQLRWQQVHNQGGAHQQIPLKYSAAADDDGGWGESWGGWGTTLLSAASTFTREVGRGVGTVVETVEGTLGVPDPETLAQEIAERQRMLEIEEELLKGKAEESQAANNPESLDNRETNTSSSDSDGGDGKNLVVDYSFGGLSSIGSLVSGVSGALETASSKVLLGGLNTLEVIGRKAMDVIQEGDPGLRKKRALLANRKPILSQVLQEARQRAAKEEIEQQEGGYGKDSKNIDKITFDHAWEVTEGPVHLEALSLVAKQCESKMASMIQSLPHYLIEKLNTANFEIKTTCELEEDIELEGDLTEQITNIVPQIGLPTLSQKVNKAWSSVVETASLIQEAGLIDGPTAERELFTALAGLVVQISAVAHKGAELSLISPQDGPLILAEHFRELINSVCGGIENIADQVCGAITAGSSAADPQINNTITNIYLQAASGKHYMHQSMGFLSSVLQYANTKQMVAQLS